MTMSKGAIMKHLLLGLVLVTAVTRAAEGQADPCDLDTDGNRMIDFSDFLVFARLFGTSTGDCVPSPRSPDVDSLAVLGVLRDSITHLQDRVHNLAGDLAETQRRLTASNDAFNSLAQTRCPEPEPEPQPEPPQQPQPPQQPALDVKRFCALSEMTATDIAPVLVAGLITQEQLADIIASDGDLDTIYGRIKAIVGCPTVGYSLSFNTTSQTIPGRNGNQCIMAAEIHIEGLSEPISGARLLIDTQNSVLNFWQISIPASYGAIVVPDRNNNATMSIAFTQPIQLNNGHFADVQFGSGFNVVCPSNPNIGVTVHQLTLGNGQEIPDITGTIE